MCSWRRVDKDHKDYIDLKIPDREDSGNLLQKWTSICININYENSQVQSYINGKELEVTNWKIPGGYENRTLIYPNANSMTVRLGKYWADGGALIGKILDFTHTKTLI